MKAETLLVTQGEIEEAAGPAGLVWPGEAVGPAEGMGEMLRAAAVDSAYRQFRGELQSPAGALPFSVGSLALVFDTAETAGRTFDQVAQAAHLRTELEEANVAVETVTAPSGLVSYWGFVQCGKGLVVLTLDTLHPQELSIAALRSLAAKTGRRLRS